MAQHHRMKMYKKDHRLLMKEWYPLTVLKNSVFLNKLQENLRNLPEL
jgi:hypothetical protein